MISWFKFNVKQKTSLYIYHFIFIIFVAVWNFQCKMNAVRREASIEADENAAE